MVARRPCTKASSVGFSTGRLSGRLPFKDMDAGGGSVEGMRDWNLPRPLVRWLDALSVGNDGAPGLRSEVLEHLEGVEHRAWALRPLLSAFPESGELWTAYGKALAGYRSAVSADKPDRDAVLDSAVALEEAVLALRGLAAELPRVTGHGALDEIFAVGMSLARGASVEPDALLSRLVAGREAVLRLQSQGALFARAFPKEEEIARHLSDSLEALEEGLGGAFLYLAEEQDADMLEQAMRTLASGGISAVAALTAMREVSESDHQYSEDPVLEELFRAVEAADSQRIEVALIAIDDAQASTGAELTAMLDSFAPESWRSRHVESLRRQWSLLESEREALHEAYAGGVLNHGMLQVYQNLGIEFDEMENAAAESMPTRASLPDVGHLVSLVEAMGAVFEERAPLSLLSDELNRLISSYRDYQEHLERVYEGATADQNSELEQLLESAEELGEGLSLLEAALETRDVAVFPRVWDALAQPARTLHRLAINQKLEGFTAEPDVALPPFFDELRQLWRDRLARRLGAGEFMQALARADKEVDGLSQQVRAGVKEGSLRATDLDPVVAELRSLCRRALTGPEADDVETIEELGQEWARQVR